MSVANARRLRVAINAQILGTGTWGGVETFIIGLVSALGKLEGLEEYLIVVHRGNRDWLNPYLGANQRTLLPPPSRFEFAKRLLGPFRFSAGTLLEQARAFTNRFPPIQIPLSNGFYETLGVDVVHFPHSYFTQSSVPMVLTLHDLQHLHYPQFFHPREIARREVFYPAGCRAAQAIAADAQWVKQDLGAQYSIAPEKIFSIPMAPLTEAYAPITQPILENVRAKLRLPEIFALYPANTWEHKNHLRLVEALALLRERDHLSVNLICTGRQNEFWRVIEQRVKELRLSNQVRFLGYVTPNDLRALYHLAQFVVFPSLFEGGGLPVLEAFRENAPVACSNVTSLPEYAGDAALLFDPLNVESIANALRRMAKDAGLREELRLRGSARIRLFTWQRTAKTYRALFRQVARVPLSEEDRALLEESSTG